MDILELTALELSNKIKKREISVLEASEAVLNQIDKNEDKLNCYVTVLEKDEVRKQAKAIQERVDKNENLTPIIGVPFAIKDNICTNDILTTASSKILNNFVPTYDATAITNLKKAGAIIIGKTNMDEFGMGSTTENSAYKITKNPYNIEHVAGGSSGGSTAAVASGECIAALGSDTGGSIREPSSYCGVTGLKPTYGTVSRYGLIAYASSLDQIGSIAKDVSDCAAILDAITSYDTKDSTLINRESCNFLNNLTGQIKGMRIGIPTNILKNCDCKIQEAVFNVASELEKQGAIIDEFELKYIDYALWAYYIIASAEASSNLARYDGVKYGYRANDYEGLHDMYKKSRTEGFGKEVKRRIMLGTFVLSEGYYDDYYLKALKVRRLMKMEFDKAFLKYDVILTPTAPSTAPRIGDSSDLIKMYQGDIYTVPVNMAGLPAISVPYGLDDNGLPIGVQLIGNSFDEKSILDVALNFERVRGFKTLKTKTER